MKRAVLVLLAACSGPAVMHDAGVSDAGGADAGRPDSGVADAGVPDAGASDAGVPDAGGPDAGGVDAGVDNDHDGLPDDYEAFLARAFLPQISLDPNEHCPIGGIVYRARPHPMDPSLVFIIYDHLYQNDCGLNGHTGDDESFAVTINPATGVTAMLAISHQNTPCQKISTCGTCGTLGACDLNDAGRPIMYSSTDKHGSYATLADCNPLTTCLDTCGLSDHSDVMLINAGEPNAHLTDDLTDAGLITAANGWTLMGLFNWNPWTPDATFGGAGIIAADLTDPSYDTAPCQ
jgi:hypothetical protein